MGSEYKKKLDEFRIKHFCELESNIEIAKQIRDNPETSAKDRMEAIKYIGRNLSALAPDRVSDTSNRPNTVSNLLDTKLSKEEEGELQRLLSG